MFWCFYALHSYSSGFGCCFTRFTNYACHSKHTFQCFIAIVYIIRVSVSKIIFTEYALDLAQLLQPLLGNMLTIKIVVVGSTKIKLF